MNETHRDSEPGLREVILDTARHLLTTEGYHNLSMRKIAGKIGYSATSIYLHFENRDQLVHALIDQGVDRLHQTLIEVDRRAQDESIEDVIERLNRLCRAYVRFGLDNPEYYEIMYTLHPEYMARYPAEKYRKARRNLMIIAETLETGMQEGIFETSKNSLSVATVVWAQLHGLVSLLNSRRVDRRVDEQRLINEVCEHILRGLLTGREHNGTTQGRTSARASTVSHIEPVKP